MKNIRLSNKNATVITGPRGLRHYLEAIADRELRVHAKIVEAIYGILLAVDFAPTSVFPPQHLAEMLIAATSRVGDEVLVEVDPTGRVALAVNQQGMDDPAHFLSAVWIMPNGSRWNVRFKGWSRWDVRFKWCEFAGRCD